MYKVMGADGNEYGPVDISQVQDWLRANRLNAQSMVQPVGGSEWKPLADYPELAALLRPAPPPVPPFPASTALPPSPRPVAYSQTVPTYLIPAILCTLLCCMPLGIPAIIYATQVTSKEARGDIAGAQIASRNAHTWCWVSFGVGVIWVIFVSILMGSMLGAGSNFRLF
jgi:hypothetical protein